MGDILSKIATQAKALNVEADRASKYIEFVSQKLRDAGGGIEYWGAFIETVVTDAHDDFEQEPHPATRKELLLGYAKVNNRWGLVLQWCTYDDRDNLINEEPPTLLENAPREDRINAMPFIDGFLAGLSTCLDNHVSELKKIADALPR